MHPTLENLLPKFAKKYDLTMEQAVLVGQRFPLYFTPNWGSTSNKKILDLLGKVAEYEGIHSHCNS